MAPIKNNKAKLWSLLSVLFVFISIAIFGIWIYAFQSAGNQPERVTIFLHYFPPFLGLRGITAIQAVIAAAAVAIGSMTLKLSPNGWKLLNIAVIAAGSLLLLLNIWGLL